MSAAIYFIPAALVILSVVGGVGDLLAHFFWWGVTN